MLLSVTTQQVGVRIIMLYAVSAVQLQCYAVLTDHTASTHPRDTASIHLMGLHSTSRIMWQFMIWGVLVTVYSHIIIYVCLQVTP